MPRDLQASEKHAAAGMILPQTALRLPTRYRAGTAPLAATSVVFLVQTVSAEMAWTVVLLVATQPRMSAQCETREMLKARVRAELRVYGDAVAVLQKHALDALSVLVDPSKGFKKARELAEHARLAYLDSRRKLEDHIASHSCD